MQVAFINLKIALKLNNIFSLQVIESIQETGCCFYDENIPELTFKTCNQSAINRLTFNVFYSGIIHWSELLIYDKTI